MSIAPPMIFQWDGDAMVPRHPQRADQHYVIGQIYTMIEFEERSNASHSHEFAWLKTAWLNLPEGLAALYPTSEHLRKRALIEAGFFDETIVDAGTAAAAVRVAAAFRSREEFALVVVRGPLVAVRTAKSQSRRAMDRHEFQASKTAIMEVIAAMVGVAPDDIGREAGRAA